MKLSFQGTYLIYLKVVDADCYLCDSEVANDPRFFRICLVPTLRLRPMIAAGYFLSTTVNLYWPLFASIKYQPSIINHQLLAMILAINHDEPPETILSHSQRLRRLSSGQWMPLLAFGTGGLSGQRASAAWHGVFDWVS